MSNNNENKLVPKLRFPEFKNSGAWVVKRLGELAERIEEKVNDKKLITASISAGKGFVSQVEKFSRDISGTQYKNYIVLSEGEFSYNKGNSKKFPQGCIYKLKEFKQVAIPNAFISFRFRGNFVGDFYQGYFDNNYHGVQLVQFITSGARMDGLLNIKADDFFSIVLPTPSKPEQQKIAACLSSLDEVITAERQKLEVLKEHKKGLLQNLFPQLSESGFSGLQNEQDEKSGKSSNSANPDSDKVPKLRFPEFVNTGEWEVKELGSLCINVVSGKDKNIADSKYDLYGSTGIIGKAEKASYEGDFILVARVGANAGFLNKVTGKFGVTDNTLVIDLINKGSVNFMFYTLESFGLNKLVFGSGQPLITGGQLKSLLMFIPTSEPEQQKIAACLSSLDDLITAQTQKIELLQQHKKGLLQGLFPNLTDEYDG